MDKKIKRAGLAGKFYPAGSSSLKDQVEIYLKNNKPEKTLNNIFGIIVPHAGYSFSGPTAAYAYNYLKDQKYDNVFIIAPSHSYINAPVGVYDYDYYHIPLGKIPINRKMVSKLKSYKEIDEITQELRPENSLEVQLPFLSVVLDDFKLVPILIRDQSLQMSKKLAHIIEALIQDKKDEKNLFVFSTDLSHYHTGVEAEKMDNLLIDALKEKNLKKISELISSGKAEACGFGCIETALVLADRFNIPGLDLLNYTHSGKVIGNNKQVVGYLSAVLYRD